MLLALAGPADAGTRYTDPAFSFEVPGGWRAEPGGTKGIAAVIYAPGGERSEFISIGVTAGKPGGSALPAGVVPAWAKRGATKLGGVPAQSVVWDEPVERRASATTVMIGAQRGGKRYVVSAVYRRPDGDLTVDRRWNLAMALVIRSWRWSR
jgi:hypothetical protein